MNEIEGFVLDYFEEDYTSEFKDAMRNWLIPNDEDKASIKRCENIIKNRLVLFNNVSAVYIHNVFGTISLYCNAGGFEIGRPIDPVIDKLVFAEMSVLGSVSTTLYWNADSDYGGIDMQILREIEGRPLKLQEKYNSIKKRKMW